MKNIDLNKIKEEYWVKNWAGHWSVLTCHYLGKQYSNRIRKFLGVNLKHSIIVIEHGFSTCYFSKKELDRLGKILASEVIGDKRLIPLWVKSIKHATREINKIIIELDNKLLSLDEYNKFIQKFISFGAANFAVKKVVDYVPEKSLKKYLPILSGARLYSESVYADTEKFMEKLGKLISKKENIRPELILCLSDIEFESYLMTGRVKVKKEVLEKRYEFSTLFFDNGKDTAIVGTKARVIEKSLQKLADKQIKGTPVYPGSVRGVARIIFDPFKKQTFNKGDILVASMTRPEYLSYIKLSSAFITDAGGMLCHAAITAREIKKPCIVGLESATKIIKSGDLIEIDADNGIVRILNK